MASRILCAHGIVDVVTLRRRNSQIALLVTARVHTAVSNAWTSLRRANNRGAISAAHYSRCHRRTSSIQNHPALPDACHLAGYAAVAILLSTEAVSFERALLTVARFGQKR